MPPSDEFVPKPCPWCAQAGGLTIGLRLAAHPLGSFSIAGAMPKTVASDKVALSCSLCTSYALGYIDGDGDFRAEQVFNNTPGPKETP